MIVITTAANTTAPAPASIVAIEPSTSATRIVTTKMSTIDQRPIDSVSRYISVRSTGRQLERRWTEISRKVRPSFIRGTKTLAVKMISASGQSAAIKVDDAAHDRVGSPLPSDVTVITGSRLAGT